MSVRLSSCALALGLVLGTQTVAVAQTPTPVPAVTATPKPKAGKSMPTPTPEPTPAPTPEPVATAEATPEAEPTPEPMPTPEPIPEEGVNAGKPTGALVHGFVITRYDNTDGKGPRKSAHGFTVQNARIRLEGKSADTVTYLAAIEPLLATGPLQEAYVGWNPRRTVGPMRDLRLRAGQMRRPIGLEGRTPEEALHTMDHSWTTRYLQGGGNYDLGMTLGTTISTLEFDLGVFNGSGPANPLLGSPVGGVDPFDDKMVVGRLGLDLMKGRLKTGFSFMSGENADPLYAPATSPGLPPDGSVQMWRAGFDLMAEVSGFVVQSEAVYGNNTLIFPAPSTPDGPTGTGSSAYLFAGYRLRYGFMPHVRFEYAELTMGDDPEDVLARIGDWNNAVAIGVNWDPVKHVRVRTQYEFVTGFASVPSGTANYYDPATGALYSDEMSGTFSASIQADF